ncbi:MAG: ATP-binding protein [Merdibacter sp.]
MRKRILRDYVLVVTAALLCGFLIFYLVVSNIMMESTKNDLHYTLKTLEALPREELIARDDALSQTLEDENSRITIIDADGEVLLDSDVDGTMENHLQREEVQMALREGEGYAIRYSTTLDMPMLYVALYSPEQSCIYRIAIPYNGLEAYGVSLLPAAVVSFVVASLIALLLARKSASSLTRPLQEIGNEIRRSQDSNVPLSFHTFHYEELNEIADTIKQMQEEIQHYIKRLKREKKIRQEFFDNASHELKTPLTSIRGYGELLKNGVVNDPQQAQECIDRILKETTHMTALITDILMISRLEGNDVVEEKVDIPLRSSVEEVRKSLDPMARENHAFLDVQAEDCCVHMSQKHLEQLLSNLISNAIKYNRENGTVDVFLKSERQRLVLSVEDSGIGISKEDQKHIFERFYRVDKGRSRRVGGTGLGLAIVKHIVRYYNGTIDVFSRENIGTKITITLPSVVVRQDEER